MAYLYRITHTFVIVCLLLSVFVPPVKAGPAEDLSASIHPVNANQFYGLSPSSVVSFSGSVTNLSSTEKYEVYLGVGIWDLWPDSEWLKVHPGETINLGLSIDPSVFPDFQFCIDGLIQVNIRILEDVEDATLATLSGTFPCTLAGDAPPPTPVSIPIPYITDEICGPDNDEWSAGELPVGIAGYDTLGWAENSIFITYVAAEGYVIVGEDTARLADHDIPCDIPVSPLPPIVNAVCGDNNDEIILADQPEGIGEASQEGWFDNSYFITYFPLDGYYIPDGEEMFEITDAGPCAEEVAVSPLPPIVNAVCGDNNDEILLVDQPEGIGEASHEGWFDNSYFITYFPLDGYYIPDGEEMFEIIDAGPCAEEVAVTPLAPIVNAVCGDNNDEIILARQPEGIGEVIEGEWLDNTYVIQYVPLEGYFIPEGTEVIVITDAGACETPVAAETETPVATSPPVLPPGTSAPIPAPPAPGGNKPVAPPITPPAAQPKTTPAASTPASSPPKESPVATAPATQPPVAVPSSTVPPGTGAANPEAAPPLPPASAPPPTVPPTPDPEETLEEKLIRLKRVREEAHKQALDSTQKLKELMDRLKEQQEILKKKMEGANKQAEDAYKQQLEQAKSGKKSDQPGDDKKDDPLKVAKDARPGGREPIVCGDSGVIGEKVLVYIGEDVTDGCVFREPKSGQLLLLIQGNITVVSAFDLSGITSGSGGVGGVGGDGNLAGTGGTGGNGGAGNPGGVGGSDSRGGNGGNGGAGNIFGSGNNGGSGSSGGSGGSGGAGTLFGHGSKGGDGGQPIVAIQNGGLRIVGQPNGTSGPISIAGAPVSIFSATASLQSAAPYSTSVVDDENTITLIDLPAGDYRLVIHPLESEDIEIHVQVVAPQAVSALPSTGVGTGVVPGNGAHYFAGIVSLAAVGGWIHHRGIPARL